MKFFNKLKELSSNCESFNSRNILEVLALVKNIKHVVRIPIKSNEWDILKQFCKENNLLIYHSNFKISVVRRTSLGDIFTENVTWDSHSESIIGFVAYIALEKNIAQNASKLESSSDSLKLGELYQYPDCCIKAYNHHIEHGGYWLDFLLKKTTGFNHSFFSNKLAYLIDETSIIPDYFPCSLDCEQTIMLGKSYRDLLIENNLLDYYQDIKEKLVKPIIVGDGIIFQLKQNLMEMDINNCKKFIWRNEDKYNNIHKNDTIIIKVEDNSAYLNNKIIGKVFHFEDK